MSSNYIKYLEESTGLMVLVEFETKTIESIDCTGSIKKIEIDTRIVTAGGQPCHPVEPGDETYLKLICRTDVTSVILIRQQWF